jgi:hypothetical protein
MIFAVLTLFRCPDGEFYAKLVFFTNFGHIDMNETSHILPFALYSDIQNLLVSASAIRHCGGTPRNSDPRPTMVACLLIEYM